MSPELFEKWDHIIQDVEKSKIPVEFIKKLIVKLQGRKQRTINVKALLEQGMEPDEIEEAVSIKLNEFGDAMISVEFILDIENIAEIVQPETDNILKDLK
jgi:hypothetical protein